MKKKSPIERVRDACADAEHVFNHEFIFVDIENQTLTLYKNDNVVMSCAVSTSRFGIGNKENSYKTPLGLHRIEEKIGDGAQVGTIFRARENTGVVWCAGMDDENQILTRILRLRGLVQGLNAGDGIDSYDRYIYIHGTNREDLIGQVASHGCVCMRNDDIVKLFDLVDVGTLVFIFSANENCGDVQNQIA